MYYCLFVKPVEYALHTHTQIHTLYLSHLPVCIYNMMMTMIFICQFTCVCGPNLVIYICTGTAFQYIILLYYVISMAARVYLYLYYIVMIPIHQVTAAIVEMTMSSRRRKKIRIKKKTQTSPHPFPAIRPVLRIL